MPRELSSVWGRLFNPAILSIVPDIVKREQIVQANSYFSMIRAGSGILGNSLGGILFSLLGAPLMFLVNGISYLFSSITELFIKVPVIHHQDTKPRFMEELRAGLSFVWTNRGLRFLMIAAGGINFFAFIGLVLVLPLPSGFSFFPSWDHGEYEIFLY